MTLRARQTELTTEAILDAAEAFLFSDADPSAFTMQVVADKAGVSHRTLYRHFGTRDELISAVGRRMDGRANVAFGIAEADSFEGWVRAVTNSLAFGATQREMLRRTILVGITTQVWRRDRDDNYYAMFRERFPHLDEATARQDFAALRHLHSSANVVLMGERFALSPEDLVGSIGRAIDALVGAIDARDREAARG